MENKDLIESLNQTKASSALIQDSLKESYKLQIFLDQVIISFAVIPCQVFLNICVNLVEHVQSDLQGNDFVKNESHSKIPEPGCDSYFREAVKMSLTLSKASCSVHPGGVYIKCHVVTYGRDVL